MNLTFCLLALLALLHTSTAQGADPVKEVESALDALNAAFTAQDATKIRALMAPDHLAVTTYGGQQTVEEQLQNLAELKYDEYSAGPMSARVVSEACVIINYALSTKGTYRGKALPSHCLVTAVWVKNDGNWQEMNYQETAFDAR